MRIRFIITPVRVLSALICVLYIVLQSGCDSDEYVIPQRKIHPAEWTNTDSPGFHGRVGLNEGLEDCLGCHGHDLTGGLAEISCFECHGEAKDNCGFCHGNPDDSTSAPPFGLRGEIDDSTLAVGAHQSHVFGSTKSAGIPCSTCHIVPTLSWDSTHFDINLFDGPGLIDSIAEITWSGLAGSTSVWNRSERTCSSTYCHGNFPRGNTDKIPVWTEQDQSVCGTCHVYEGDLRPIGRNHIFHNQFGIGCYQCHALTIDPLMDIIGPEFHVDGEKTLKFFPDVGSVSDSITCIDMVGCHPFPELERTWY